MDGLDLDAVPGPSDAGGHLPGLVRTSARGVVAGDAGGRLPGFGVQRQQGVDGLDLDSVPGPSDAGGRLPGFGVQRQQGVDVR